MVKEVKQGSEAAETNNESELSATRSEKVSQLQTHPSPSRTKKERMKVHVGYYGDENSVQELPGIEKGRFKMAYCVLGVIALIMIFGMCLHVFVPGPQSADIFEFTKTFCIPVVMLILGTYFGKQSSK